jgi:uncharacterized protein YifN (PemK superfamily)
MIKERLALVVSPRLPHRDRLCTIVPLSSSPARSGIKYQCRIELPVEAPPPYAGKFKWAKADMFSTVCYDRLSLPYTGRDPSTGKRKYLQIIAVGDELKKVQTSVLYALGLDHLTGHV